MKKFISPKHAAAANFLHQALNDLHATLPTSAKEAFAVHSTEVLNFAVDCMKVEDPPAPDALGVSPADM